RRDSLRQRAEEPPGELLDPLIHVHAQESTRGPKKYRGPPPGADAPPSPRKRGEGRRWVALLPAARGEGGRRPDEGSPVASATVFSRFSSGLPDVTSLKNRLRQIILGTTVAALLLAWLADGAGDLVNARSTLKEDLATLADVIASNSAAAVTFGDAQSAARILSALRARDSITGAAIYTKTGKSFAKYREGRKFSGDHIEVARPILLDGEVVGTLYVVSDLRETAKWMKQYTVAA